jgi:pimeloyl-ACP methyl ester carboxylesterase
VGSFTFTSADGTEIAGWCNGATSGVPVVISNGCGCTPEAWPGLLDPDCGFQASTFYYRGTFGSARPANRRRIRVADHADDLLALIDHEGHERPLIAAWSLGVNIAFELAERHPDRVGGILAVAGVPGGLFLAVFGPLGVPRPLRTPGAVMGTRLGGVLGPAVSFLAHRAPVNGLTARIVNHSGLILPAAQPALLGQLLVPFLQQDFRWWAQLAGAGGEHQRLTLTEVEAPVAFVGGRYDVLVSWRHVARAASLVPDGRLDLLPGSHFLPLEFPEVCRQRLLDLADRAGLPHRKARASRRRASKPA